MSLPIKRADEKAHSAAVRPLGLRDWSPPEGHVNLLKLGDFEGDSLETEDIVGVESSAQSVWTPKPTSHAVLTGVWGLDQLEFVTITARLFSLFALLYSVYYSFAPVCLYYRHYKYSRMHSFQLMHYMLISKC